MNKNLAWGMITLVTALHIFRFQLPEAIRDIYMVLYLDYAAWAVSFLMLFLYEENIKIKTLYLFNIGGVINAFINLYRGNPDPGLFPEVILFFVTVLCCGMYYWRNKPKRKTNRKLTTDDARTRL